MDGIKASMKYILSNVNISRSIEQEVRILGQVFVIYSVPQPAGGRIDGGLLRRFLIQSIVYSGIICCFHG